MINTLWLPYSKLSMNCNLFLYDWCPFVHSHSTHWCWAPLCSRGGMGVSFDGFNIPVPVRINFSSFVCWIEFRDAVLGPIFFFPIEETSPFAMVGWYHLLFMSPPISQDVSVFFYRCLKAIGSGAVSRCRWTAPFSQASMGCGTFMSSLWCSCMHHPIRTMGTINQMVSSGLFSIT